MLDSCLLCNGVHIWSLFCSNHAAVDQPLYLLTPHISAVTHSGACLGAKV